MIKIKKGLDLPITGKPSAEIQDFKKPRQVALIASDYIGMKPTMKVKEGDHVNKGQVLFSDKKNTGVVFTAPASGKIFAINRGEKRAFQSIVINCDDAEPVKFYSYIGSDLSKYDRQQCQDLLVESGVWTSFRTRPFSRTPELGSLPHSIFVTAIDTHPLAPEPSHFINAHSEAFKNGLLAMTKLTKGSVFVCVAPGFHPPGSELGRVRIEEFSGPHPAGLAGTHIHYLDPVSAKKTVWTIGYQDLIAVGYLFLKGELFTERLISLAGPSCRNPRLIRTQLGASLEELTRDDRYGHEETRLVSGSVLGGRKASLTTAFLGRFHNQVTMLKEGRERELLGWHSPGINKFSIKNIYLSKLFKNKKFAFTTNTNGSPRSLVPINSFEAIMPLDILPTHLLRALLSKDTETAQKLGCLELDEEDLALCSFVDPCKHEFGPILRDNLSTIEKEG